MAIKELKDINKRPRYFAGQYLLEDDFELEQDYARDRLQRYTRSLHVSGIADGLIASKPNDATLKLIVDISAGTAIDSQGRQVVLLESRQVDLSKDLVETIKLDDGSYILSIGYDEQETEPQDGNASTNRRILENPVFKLSSSAASDDFIAIAKLTIKGGVVSIADDSNSVRKYTGLRLPALENAPTLRSKGGNLAVFSGSLEIAGSQTVGSTTLESHLYLSGGTGPFAQFYRDAAIDGKDYLGIEAFKQNDAQTKSAIVLQEFGGNVGIGTANPGTKLEVSGGDLKVSGNISATNESLTGNLSVIGNVGIGTTNPDRKLTIKADYSASADAQQLLIQGASNANNQLAIGYHTTGNYGSIQAVTQNTSVRPLVLNPGGGNVGIGTTNPSGFQIVLPESSKGSSPFVSAGVTIAGGASGNANIELRNAGTGTPYIDFAQNATTTDYDARIRLTEPGKLAIEGANVGIGTTTPAANLQVRDTIGSRNNYDFSKTALLVNSQTHNGGNSPANAESVLALAREGVPNQSYGNMVDFRLSNYKNVAPVDGTQLDLYLTEGQFSPKQVMSLRANGNVGIGTTTPSANLHVNGRIKDKTGWVMPVGSILPYAGTTAPEGWLLCNGNSLDSTTFVDLFNIIGFQYGGSANKFNLPNLQGRVPVGLSTEEEFNVLAKVGGAKTHLLKESEMPSHNHGVNDPGHNHAIQPGDKGGTGHCDDADGSGRPWAYTLTAFTNISIQNTGGGQAHNNLQPYITINYIIKY